MSEKSKPLEQIRKSVGTRFAHPPSTEVQTHSAEKPLHELQVYQVELQMQNEILRQSQIALEESRDRFVDFYDFAPSGYITLSRDALVTEINLTGTILLGMKRNRIVNSRFVPFISTEDRDRWHHFFQSVLNNPNKMTCELKFLRGDGTHFYALLDCLCLKHEGKAPVVRIVVTDITERKKQEWRLNQMGFALNNVKESVYLINEEGYFQYVNNEVSRVLGYTCGELLDGMSVLDISTIMTNEKWAAHWKYIKIHGSVIFESKQRTKDGRELPVEVSSSYFEYEGTGFVMGIVRDLTNHYKTDAEERIAATIFKSQEGMIVTDNKGIILRANEAFTNITGYSAEEVVGKNPNILSSGRHDVAFYTVMWENIKSNGSWDGEIWNRRKNGEIYPEHLTITSVKNQTGDITNYVATLTDITMSKNAADEIRNLAFYDPLTQLPNRRLLHDRLLQALSSSDRNGQTGAMLFIDLDNFKIINDTLGHAMGDLLLQEVAERLKSCVRAGDTVARLGGDEFVVMLENLNSQSIEAASQAEVIGEKILSTLNQPYRLGIIEHLNSSSIGIVLFNGHQQQADDLFKQADLAMYQAKKEGRNTLRFFDPKMQDAINSRSEIEAELRKAIGDHQFHLYYQIQMSHQNHLIGAEALIRWKHPERGLVPPAEFIPIAEETGLILPIGQWVLETACAQLEAWQLDALTHDLILSVNVSAKQFRQADFVAQVKSTIQRYAINPTGLKLELTESVVLDNIDDIINTMTAINAIGVRFSLDDFGTGYSSLQYLKRLPLNQLKIDQSFVRDLVVNSNDKAIVSTIVMMAHSLNLEVIAEGVETEEQRQYLEKVGCTQYQGYLFGKPVPIEQLALLNKG